MEDFVSLGRLVTEYGEEIKKVSPFRLFVYRAFLLKNWGSLLFLALFLGFALGGGYLLGMLENKVFSWIFMGLVAISFVLIPIFIVRGSAARGSKCGYVATLGRTQIELEFAYKLLKTAEVDLAAAGDNKAKVINLVWDKARAITYAQGIASDNLNLMSNNLIKIKDEKFIVGIRKVNEVLNKIFRDSDKMLEAVTDEIEKVDPESLKEE